MKYYIFSYKKTTGPYTFEELKGVLKAFPLKKDMEVITDEEYLVMKKMEAQLNG